MTGVAATPAALLIAPAFFGYEKDVVAEFERQGFAVTFIDERPTNSAIGRAVMRFRRELVGRKIASYYRAWQARLSGRRFDIVLVIKAEITPRWFLEWLRSENPDARLVFYLWDPISHDKNCLQVLDVFDQRFSFDPDDVAQRSDLDYLPLFYAPDFSPLSQDTAKRQRRYSMSYVGTLHPGRFALVTKVFANRPKTFRFFYVQARWYFAVRKYLTRGHPGVRWADVSFTPMSRRDLADTFRNSHAVVDMPSRGQVGLTLRTFEVLASGAVLVTTNSAVTHERFYDPERIIVVDEEAGPNDIDELWSRLDSAKPPSGSPRGFEEYSLASWVRRVVSTGAASKRGRANNPT